jgi:glutathione synthase/RimK-type ligase-like ATP-grasp enzyme
MQSQGLSPAEVELAHKEASNILRGALTCAVGRWVDPPAMVEAAEDKLGQLELAHRLNIATPATLVTSDPEAARMFATEGPIVAKAVSSGTGIQPFTGDVRPDLLELVAQCPVLLQRRVEARADLRVVTVGSELFAWSRGRDPGGPVDWRATDPAGIGFRVVPAMPVADSAQRLSGALGLSHSTQDWLLTEDGPVFLEVNPQGQWLFLDGAERSVVPALASLLAGR